MIVLDASAAVEWLCGAPAGGLIARRLLRERPLHAPHLLDLEVASVLRRQCALKSLTVERARQALLDFQDLLIARHPHTPYLDRIWELRHWFTAYDAVYLALAEALGATLLTVDRALATAKLKRGRVEVVDLP